MADRTRRQFIEGAAGVGAAVVLGACRPGVGPGRPGGGKPSLPDGLFSLGVASGDPRPHSVLLWTRLAPDPLNGGGMPEVTVPVRYEVARDESFRHVVKAGVVRAEARWGHSVHAEVRGLRPDAWHWYRFIAGDETSPVGRARTSPAPGRSSRLAFLFASCQNYRHGYYTAWDHAAREDADLVLHLGDYIYEGGFGGDGVRDHNSPPVWTLEEYRNRYALYKGDPALQAAHAAAPWAVTWDDHEVHDNYAGWVPKTPEDQAAFAARRAAAYQAWWEHQPVRMPPPVDGNLAVHRSVDWGRQVRFHLLDTRQYRDNQPCGTSDWGTVCPERDDPSRTFLGFGQEEWLGRSLRRSRATWDVLASSVVMSAMPFEGVLYNFDQWDGYPAARARLFDQLREAGTANPVVVSGDVHASAVGTVVGEGDLAEPPMATELVGTSISSNFGEELFEPAERLLDQLDHLQWINPRKRGYVRCDVDGDGLVAQYRLVDTVHEPTSPIASDTSWRIRAGRIGAEQI